MNYICT